MELNSKTFSVSRKGVLSLIALSKLERECGIGCGEFYEATGNRYCDGNGNAVSEELITLGLVEEFAYSKPHGDMDAKVRAALANTHSIILANMKNHAFVLDRLKKNERKLKALTRGKKPISILDANEIIQNSQNWDYPEKTTYQSAVGIPEVYQHYRLTQAGKDLINGLTVTIKTK